MKKICLLFVLHLSLIFYSTSFAMVNCPPIEWIKATKFAQAFSDPYDPDCWNFISPAFEYSGKVWTIFFGTFMEGIRNREEALDRANAFLQNAKIIISKPKAIPIPDHLLCDYMPEGREFWLSAITPPEQL